ncbi:diguanylate cyclase, partial [Aquabacterium sp.]|uniref:GGDEF domain-containing protein n=1 Tax=Aquabacterium sp. TaxID=1872578 RepID=UPI0025C59450
ATVMPGDVGPSDSEAIDALIRSGQIGLRFPPSLEARFQLDSSPERMRKIVVSGLLVTVLFNVFLLSDWFMVPDQFDLALRLRLLCFSPLVLAGLLLLVRVRSWRLREGLTAVSGITASAISAWICHVSTDVLAPAYLVGLAMIVLFSNSVAQMRFWPALWMDMVVLGLFVLCAIHKPEAPLALLLPIGLVLVSTTVFTLYACFTQETDERRHWLMRLRERLLMSELGEANEHLHKVSRSDMLTGVANRHHLDEFMARIWASAREDGREVSVMMIDIDHFKAYNDRYGHLEGDACLKEVASALKRRLRRPDDLIARFGGEEFIVVLSGTPLSTAVAAAERVRKSIEGLNRLHSASTTHAIVTVSIGVACLKPNAPHATVTQLIAAADEALYLAKQGGRNRVLAFGIHA